MAFKPLELRRGIQDASCVGPGKSNLPFELRRKAGDCSRVIQIFSDKNNVNNKKGNLGELITIRLVVKDILNRIVQVEEC